MPSSGLVNRFGAVEFILIASLACADCLPSAIMRNQQAKMRERDLVKEQDPVDLDVRATEVAMGRFCDNH